MIWRGQRWMTWRGQRPIGLGDEHQWLDVGRRLGRDHGRDHGPWLGRRAIDQWTTGGWQRIWRG